MIFSQDPLLLFCLAGALFADNNSLYYFSSVVVRALHNRTVTLTTRQFPTQINIIACWTVQFSESILSCGAIILILENNDFSSLTDSFLSYWTVFICVHYCSDPHFEFIDYFKDCFYQDFNTVKL